MRHAVADRALPVLQSEGQDFDYLVARLHGRRSRMAEGDRLNALCRLNTLTDLYQSVFPASDLKGVGDFQRLCVSTLGREISGLVGDLSGPAARLIRWFLTRLEIENLKVLVRTHFLKTDETDLGAHMVTLPKKAARDSPVFSTAGPLTDFVRLLPDRFLRREVEKAVLIHADKSRPFFLETALDQAYLRELLARAGQLLGEDQEIISPVTRQEVDIFNLALVIRGRFFFGLTPETLLPLHVTGGRIRSADMNDMLKERDLQSAAARLAGVVFDNEVPRGRLTEPCQTEGGDHGRDYGFYERLAWKRFLRFSNLAFRRSRKGIAAVVGYIGIRRVEVANLITLSEGIRHGMSAEGIRARMIAPSSGEAVHA